jgi:hypothetical protein
VIIVGFGRPPRPSLLPGFASNCLIHSSPRTAGRLHSFRRLAPCSRSSSLPTTQPQKIPVIPRMRHGARQPSCERLIRSPKRFAARVAVLAFLAFLVFTATLRSKLPSAPVVPAGLSPSGVITVWYPTGHCHGRFATGPAPESSKGLPYALLREAVVDRRHASLREFRSRTHTPKPFLRLVLFVTVHLSVSLVTPSSSGRNVVRPSVDLFVHNTSGAATGYAAQVDYVLIANPHVIEPGVYKPGKKAHYGEEVTEWEVIVTLTPATPSVDETDATFAARLQDLSREPGSDAQLRLSLPFKRYDNAPMAPFDVALSLPCILGWDDDDAYPRLPRFRSGKTCDAGADGAVAFVGSALHGFKRSSEAQYYEIAHFAARALLGPMPFDAVCLNTCRRWCRSSSLTAS